MTAGVSLKLVMDEMTNDENDDDVDAILATKPPVPDQIVFAVGDDIMPVSYTHLTLPTNREV